MSSKKKIEFVYFDLGNILVQFDRARACENVATLAGISLERANEFVCDGGAQNQYETGEVTSEEFWELARESLGLDEQQLPKQAYLEAISDMFTPIDSMVEIVEYARRAAGRVGVLSNTCVAHWEWVRSRPWPVSQIDYDVKILSYEVKSMKPDAGIYEAAEAAANVKPDQILFVDDRAENVEAAKKRGWNAFQCLGGKPVKAILENWL